jgi:DHA2 family methylenomycin A resistance protein-like MFS transporter
MTNDALRTRRHSLRRNRAGANDQAPPPGHITFRSGPNRFGSSLDQINATATEPSDHTQPPDAATARRLTLIATSLGFAVVQLDVSVVNVAIKSIGADLGGGVGALQLIVSAYTIAFAAFILTAGALGDRIGAKRVFIAGFALFTIASAVCGLAPNLAVLVAARVVQGVGAAVLLPCSLSLLNHSYTDPAARARAVGLYLAGASAALSGGPLIGGVLIATLGWRSIFFINVPVAILGVYLTVRWASETTRSPERGVDLPGQLTAILALTALASAIIEGGSSGFGDPLVLAGFALAAIAGVAFLVVERSSRTPMLPLGLFRSRTFSSAAAIGLLVNVVFYGLIFILSLLFQDEQRRSPLETGLALAPIMLAITASNLGAGRVSGRFGPAKVIAAGALLLSLSCAALLGTGAHTSYAAIVIQLAGIGFGGGLIVPVVTSEMLGSVERSRSGVAAGTLNTLRQTGSSIGVALFGSLIAGGFTSGLHSVLVICIAVSVSLGVLTLTIEPRPRSGT